MAAVAGEEKIVGGERPGLAGGVELLLNRDVGIARPRQIGRSSFGWVHLGTTGPSGAAKRETGEDGSRRPDSDVHRAMS
jgi:hypothetical protein